MNHLLAPFLLLFLLAYADFTYSKVHYITPSLDSPCPQYASPCLTLSQFAANSSDNETDLSLLFLPGNHTLDQELLLVHGHNFSMSKCAKDNETVFVKCNSQLGRFDISETTYVSIKSLTFIGCGGNRVSQVTSLIIADSTFQEVLEKSTVLVINEVNATNIERSQFLNNTHEHYDSKSIQDLLSLSPDALLDYIYYNIMPNTSSGVLYMAFSNISVVSCRFMYNRADIGGALVAHNSSVHIDKTTLSYNTANFGGTMVTSGSKIHIDNSFFSHNLAREIGGVLVTYNDMVSINSNALTSNSAAYGGAIATSGDSSFNITNSNFTSNSAAYYGGAIVTSSDSSFNITNSNFTSNSADRDGGAIATSGDSSFNITNSNFTSNSAAYYGGAIVTSSDSSFNITNSNFTSNSADRDGGAIATSGDSSFNITNSNFTSNSAAYYGGAIVTSGDSSFNITNSNFTSNRATYRGGGAIGTYGDSSFNITNSKFTSNRATYGGVMDTSGDSSLITISNSNFTYNSATSIGGIIRCSRGTLSIDNSNFSSNTINTLGGGLMFTISPCSTNIANTTFDDNVGSIYTFNSNLNFSGNSKFRNSTKVLTEGNESTSQEGGVITSFQSTVIFTSGSTTHFSNSRARDGCAILAIESTVIMYGETTIANNNITTIANSSGGGISLKQSRLDIRGRCNIENNSAVRGGGIHATSSTIAVHQPGSLQLISNNAKFGGGMYLEVNSKLYVLKTSPLISRSYFVNFTGNNANYGGAVYVADDTNSGTCSPNNECFIQSLALHQSTYSLDTVNILLSENTATEQGSNLFGGLLDRCIPSPFAEVYLKQDIHYSGITYLQNITENQNNSITENAQIHSISSHPVRVCFCNIEHKPNCSYQLPTITVKKGEAFNVFVVAVDQVNNTVEANITTSISSSDGGFGEGQQTQSVGRNCTDLTYNVFSPHDNETINLYADGPCGSVALSTSQVTIYFKECTCPVGFQPLSKNKSSTRCECVCDSNLSPYITDCDHATSVVFRVDTNSWITYINNTDSPEFVKYPYCPYDYCKPLTENVSINFNLPNGADAQCAYNRTGMLCGSCIQKFSLSLASSRCLPCHSHWPAVCVVILLTAILAGILLVTALLALNMTVSVGLINGFIFYANIVSAGSAVFFPSSEPSFPSVFVAWLNLEVGIDACFINGLDAYIKTWLQLAFPLYIIFLVVTVIIVSEYSLKFARLIGRKDPVSTLATLILLSYDKLLSVTITALSFAKLDYPDGKQEIVWLPDGNVKYFQGKHIPIVLVALLIILIGLPYTMLLFLWQWIVRAPKWKIFKWTRSTKLNAFIATYHVPHNSKYRFWTGLLLLVRVILYVTASVTVSANPQTFPLISNILIGGLFLFKGLLGLRVYKNSLLDIVDTVLYFNLLALAVFTLYEFKSDLTKQTAVAYISTIITFILFIGSICYHLRLLFKKEKPPQELNEYHYSPIQPASAEVTYSIIELPKRDQDQQPDKDRNETEISENCHITPPYTQQ